MQVLSVVGCAGLGITVRPDGVALTYSSPTWAEQAGGVSQWISWLQSAPLDEARAHAPGVAAWADSVLHAVQVAK